MNRSHARLLGGALLLAAATALSGCGVTATPEDTGNADGPITGLQVLVPNDPGGGYDTTGRSAVKVMEEAGLIEGAEVTNLPGAGGTVGLARAVNEEGNGKFLMVMGLGLVGAAYTNQTDAQLSDTTPIARLIEEAGGIFVPADSPYETLADLIDAWKVDPAGFAVGGGSSAGGPDHLLPMLLADAVGISPSEVNFVSYAGGGDLLPAILGGQLQFAASGYPEFLEQVESGDLRLLAITSEKPIDVVDAPTLIEEGVDLVFTNWRGFVAPPGISDEDRDALIDALTQMHDSDAWQDVLEKNGWTDAFLTGDDYGDFLSEQDKSVQGILADLGLV